MGKFIITILIFVGACIIAGVLSRGTDSDNADRDNVIMTFMRGFVVMAMLTTFAGIIIGILSLFIDFDFLQ